MCGILAVLGIDPNQSSRWEELQSFLAKRGPDYQSSIISYQAIPGKLDIFTKASVLHLRGNTLQPQPLADSCNNILLFNGQIYKFLGIPLELGISDTKFLLDKLSLCTNKSEIAETFAEIDGPFAFIYWNCDLKSLFYGRDLFGRKSLCVLSNDDLNYPIAISSVAPISSFHETGTWHEVSCAGFHCVDFSNLNEPKRTLFSWNIDSIYPRTQKCLIPKLDENVDCVLIKSRPIAPLNLDRRSEFNSYELQVAPTGLGQKLLQAVAIRTQNDIDRCLGCRQKASSLPETAPVECDHTKFAVAFSGGIDSALLALALDKVTPKNETIDLVTVAFKEDSPDRSSVASAFRELRSLCPSRNWRLVLCDINKSELEQRRSDTIRHLISPCQTVIDDSIGCACWFIGRARGRSLDSFMDNSTFEEVFERFLCYNDLFCQTGEKNFSSDKIRIEYTSPATMFFVGSSIDEQLGGYGSHKTAWSNSGTLGLFNEISFLMRRISSRNLGRDDRVYSDHGRDVKLPYLDYELVSYLNQLPISLKMNLDEPSDIGPKKLLRELANSWGLKESSRRVKRALQFGTRIANLENPHEKGGDLCQRLI